MNATHPWITGLFGNGATIQERSVMQFEPLTSDSCKPGHPERALMNAGRTPPAAQARRRPGGYVAILVAAVHRGFLMMPLCAISVDVSVWYVEVQRVQNAADAAAMAGVTFLPDDFTSAKATAITVAGRNGYPNSGTSVSVGVRSATSRRSWWSRSTAPSRTAFGSAFGVKTETIERSATADFNGPVLMGSPCNTFGNEPPGSTVDPTDPSGPTGSVIVAPAGGAQCTQHPQLWGAIAGPDTPKGNGDEYMTRTCNTGDARLHRNHERRVRPAGLLLHRAGRRRWRWARP